MGVFRDLRSIAGLYTASIVSALREKANPALPSFMHEAPTGQGGGIEPLDQDFTAYLQSPGMFHTVSACVDAISNAAAAIPWKLMRTAGDGAEEVTTHPLIDLIENPNPEQGAFSFRFGIGQQIGYTGEGIITTDAEDFRRKLIPGRDELWTLRSDRMAPVPNKAAVREGKEENPIREWIYSGPSQPVHLAPERVIQIKRPHPTDPWRGLSPLKQLETILSIEWHTLQQIRNYLKRGARPASVFSREDRPSAEDVTRFKEQFATEYGGAANSGKTLFLWGKGLKFDPLGQPMISAHVLAFLEHTRQAIMSVYKVPPLVLASNEGQTWATAREQRKSFYTEAVIPLTTLILDTLNASPLVRAFDNGRVYFAADWSSVDALQPDREAQAKQDHIYVTAGVRTINEIREHREFGEPVEWGDEPRQPPSPFGDLFGEPIEDAEKGYHAEIRAAKATKDKGEAKALRWKAFVRRTQPIERAWLKALRPLFDEMESEVLATLARLDPGTKSKAADDPVPAGWTSADWFDFVKAFDTWTAELAVVAARSMQTGAEDVLREVSGMFVPFDMEAPEVARFVDERLARQIRTILESRQSEVVSVVTRSVDAGETINQLEKALRQKFNRESKVWSMRIARTETSGLYNAGAQAGMVEAGIDTKEWLSSRESNVRETHRIADGQEAIPIGEDFRVGDATGPYPGEMNLAEENINCRCSHIAGGLV